MYTHTDDGGGGLCDTVQQRRTPLGGAQGAYTPSTNVFSFVDCVIPYNQRRTPLGGAQGAYTPSTNVFSFVDCVIPYNIGELLSEVHKVPKPPL
jgi:hypothetical protein